MSDDVPQNASAVHRHDALMVIRLLVIAAIIVAIIAVGFDNRDDVRVGYAVGDTQAPIWMVIVIAAIAGMVIGWLIRHRPRHHV